MYRAVYLLSIEGFLEEKNGKALLGRAFSCVDDTRREKAERMRPGRAQAACLGAGLLLQLAVREAVQDGAAVVFEKGNAKKGNAREANVGKGNAGRTVYSVRDGRQVVCGQINVTGMPEIFDSKKHHILNGITIDIKQYSTEDALVLVEKGARQSLSYVYGEKGKPYFRDLPFYFSLSHSEDYVLCVLSTEEVGADIQRHQTKANSVKSIANRFFTEQETAWLEASLWAEELFFQLWTRKEAYGKLTGEGVAGILGVDMLPGEERGKVQEMKPLSGENGAVAQETNVLSDGRKLVWEEYSGLAGYSIAICWHEEG